MKIMEEYIMSKKPLNDEVIANLIESIENSEKRQLIHDYISEVTQTCVSLCSKGENVRVLNEYKIMIKNIRKHLNF